MHDDDLRNFFDEDAYKELLDTYTPRACFSPYPAACPFAETRRTAARAQNGRL